MEKKIKIIKIACAVCVLLMTKPVFGQSYIKEVFHSPCTTSIAKAIHDTAHIVYTRYDGSQYFDLFKYGETENINMVLPYDVVEYVTDFVFHNGSIYFCGKKANDSVWVAGTMPLASDVGQSYASLFELPYYYAKHLKKIRVYDGIVGGDNLLLIGETPDNDPVIIEVDDGNNVHRSRAIVLKDSTNIKYTADDIAITDNYIIVSTHMPSSSNEYAVFSRGRLWFIDKPSGMFPIGIFQSTVHYEYTPFFTKNELCLTEKTGDAFYLAGSKDTPLFFSGLSGACVTRYYGTTCYNTLRMSGGYAKAVQYDASSDRIALLVSSDGGDKLYSIQGNQASTATVSGQQFGGYTFHSLTRYPDIANKVIASGIHNISPKMRFLGHDMDTNGTCGTPISTSFTSTMVQNINVELLQYGLYYSCNIYPTTISVPVKKSNDANIICE